LLKRCAKKKEKEIEEIDSYSFAEVDFRNPVLLVCGPVCRLFLFRAQMCFVLCSGSSFMSE